MQYYIGLSTSGHDPAFAIVDSNGYVIFAEASERFFQSKRAWGIAPDHIDHIAPHLEKILKNDPAAVFYVSTSWTRAKQDLLGDGGSKLAEPSSALVSSNLGAWLLGIQAQIHQKSGHNIRTVFQDHIGGATMNFDHHLCHAANGVYSAPFKDGLVLVADGEGETGSISVYRLQKRTLKRLWRSWGPGSLGTFYCWLTSLCGFSWVAGEEWKVMGLAAYGTPDPDLLELLERVLIIENGRPLLAEQSIISTVTETLFCHRRLPTEPVEKAANLAATGQLAYQRYMNRIVAHLEKYKEENLIFCGGCALNSSYNGSLLSNSSFKQVHLPSAPADDGNAIGAALLAWNQVSGKKAIPSVEGACYLGSLPDARTIESTLNNSHWKSCRLPEGSPLKVAEQLAKGKIIGIFRGAAEFGPRALGHRSILADPRPEGMKDAINRQIKGREAYRPFAPMILEECQSEWFENAQDSPFMSFTLSFRADKTHLVPAVVHADGTGRLQTVNKLGDPWLYELLQEFYRLTGVPIILNTSFNVMGKPIVHSVQDAVAMFATTGLDGLLLKDVYFEK